MKDKKTAEQKVDELLARKPVTWEGIGLFFVVSFFGILVSIAVWAIVNIAFVWMEPAPASEKPWTWTESPKELRVIYQGTQIYKITSDSKITYTPCF